MDVERSNGAVKTAFDIQVKGNHGPGRPKMTWQQLTERDCREWKLSAIDPHDRDTWRSGVRSACSKPVAWKAAHCCGYGPYNCTLIKNPMLMMMMMTMISRRAVVSYWRKYVHEVLVNRLGGLSLPRKSVVRLTDCPDMTLDVYRGRKTPIQQQYNMTMI